LIVRAARLGILLMKARFKDPTCNNRLSCFETVLF
jgi:hypothetical protein